MRNIVRCRLCKDIIESRHKEHFVTCKCNEIFIEGGPDIFIRGAITSHDNIIEAKLDGTGQPIEKDIINKLGRILDED